MEDEDMARLQKKPRQVEKERQATSTKTSKPKIKPVKLTPAEIRAQNNVPSVQKPPSRRHSSHIRHARQLEEPSPPERSGRALTAYEKQGTRSSTTPLPTPPHTPVSHYSRSIHPQHLPPNFSMPRSHVSAQADHLIQSAMSSRRSSVSSYRGLPTYRGPELTRTGSFTLLQHPSQQIIANPLSNFSRPRRGTSASPARSKLSIDDIHACDHDEDQPYTYRRSSPSISDVSDQPVHTENNNPEPPVRNISPVSFEANQSIRDFTIIRDGVEQQHFAPSISGSAMSDAHLETAVSMKVSKMGPGQALRNNGHQQANTSSKVRSRFRRHTMSTSEVENTSAYAAQKARSNSNQDQPSQSFDAHPAVRPLTVAIPPSGILKGKERENGSLSAPVVRCCHKCGKMRKPGVGSDVEALSPVLENPQVASMKTTEGIFMSGGAGDPPPPKSPKRVGGVKWEDRRAEGKIRPPPPPKIMRFASLRGYTTEGMEEMSAASNDSGISMGEYEGDGVRPLTAEGNQGQLLTAEEEEHANWMQLSSSAEKATETDEFVPAREQQSQMISPGIQTLHSDSDQALLNEPIQKPWQPLQDSTSESESEAEARTKGVKLPRPNVSPRFSRSNQTLRGLVLSERTSYTNLMDEMRKSEWGPDTTTKAPRPNTAPNGTVRGVEGDENGDGDASKGLEQSNWINEMRAKEAMRVAEIMAV